MDQGLLARLRRGRLPRPVEDSPWLLPKPRSKGAHITTHHVGNGLRATVRAAGIDRPGITPHTLRYSFATQMLEAGVNARVVQAMLRHRNIGTTTHYAQVRTDLIAPVPDPPRLPAGAVTRGRPAVAATFGLPARAGVGDDAVRLAEISRRRWATPQPRPDRLSPRQRRVLQTLLKRRRAAPGGQVYVCDRCGCRLPAHNSCRNRHCPTSPGRWARPGRSLPSWRRWVVYVQPPFSRSTHLVRYLGRDTQRPGISYARPGEADDRGATFRTHGDDTGPCLAGQARAGHLPHARR